MTARGNQGNQDQGSQGNQDQGSQENQDDHQDADPGLARARTSLAWTRTALSFAAVGVVVLRRDLLPGLIILAAVPVIWQLGRLAHHLPGRLRLVTVTIVAIAVVALAVALSH